MSPPLRVIVATDGSDAAVAAAKRATAMLTSDLEPIVVAVIDPSPTVTMGVGAGLAGATGSPATINAVWDAERAEAAVAIARTTEAMGVNGAEHRVATGHAGRVLCDLAAELEADMIIVGSRGQGWLRRALLGSVSGYVVHNAPCPVLVVRDDREADDHARPPTPE